MGSSDAVSSLSPNKIAFEIQRGGRFFFYQYCVSLLMITFRRNSSVSFIRAGENAVLKGLPFTLLSLVLGWWGIPFGLVWTPMALARNAKAMDKLRALASGQPTPVG